MVVRFAAMCVVFYTFLCPQLTDSPRPHLVRPGIWCHFQIRCHIWFSGRSAGFTHSRRSGSGSAAGHPGRTRVWENPRGQEGSVRFCLLKALRLEASPPLQGLSYSISFVIYANISVHARCTYHSLTVISHRYYYKTVLSYFKLELCSLLQNPLYVLLKVIQQILCMWIIYIKVHVAPLTHETQISVIITLLLLRYRNSFTSYH